MNQTLVSTIGNKNIFLVSDEKIPFYISIPEEQNVSIVINLLDNPDEVNTSKANMAEIPNKVTEINNKFVGEGIAVVTPIIDTQIMTGVKENTNPQYISFLNQSIGYIINKAYDCLKQNGKSLYQQIKLNNNETYRAFNEKFASMYPDRIELGKYDETITNTFVNQSNIPVTPIAPDNQELANTTNIGLDEAYTEVNETPVEEKGKTKTKEPGFVSYVLLGVIVAILSLVGLYLLL